jgi:hypothetical protein
LIEKSLKPCRNKHKFFGKNSLNDETNEQKTPTAGFNIVDSPALGAIST